MGQLGPRCQSFRPEASAFAAADSRFGSGQDIESECFLTPTRKLHLPELRVSNGSCSQHIRTQLQLHLLTYYVTPQPQNGTSAKEPQLQS